MATRSNRGSSNRGAGTRTDGGAPTVPPEEVEATSPETPDPFPSSTTTPEPPEGGPDMQPAYPPGEEPS